MVTRYEWNRTDGLFDQGVGLFLVPRLLVPGKACKELGLLRLEPLLCAPIFHFQICIKVNVVSDSVQQDHHGQIEK